MSASQLPKTGFVASGALFAPQYWGIILLAAVVAVIVWMVLTKGKA
ncbi:hypothetical protein [Periweissella ghanensis]|uniref:Uncharacterized protein n=1 Tax=Periweissella ghanensis TaxID=467997 RepID=A0ABN8BIM3_9LACO|nr:hypothetical protein [Periweissella ghanensis]MCM0600986.1 hypothetical protein [Periweissella ghanensis]CAH0417597.1 hypothetical protein WGH24286_00009 [Periweissella ghanensis]